MDGQRNFEKDRLVDEIEQEKQMKDILEQSVSELKITVEELEKRFDSLDEENNEWKTRFETQQEMNQQLEKQCELMQEKIDEARKTLNDVRKPKTQKQSEEMGEVNSYFVRALEKDKLSLEKQIRDMEWRLDHESKAYHKANEERKHFLLEIKGVGVQIGENKLKRDREQTDRPTPRDSVNIPEDQRILDPKRGPIKKTAAVKKLDKL